MSTAAQDPLVESLVSDFGGNYVFALDLLDQYRQDPAGVEPGWRAYFDKLTGRGPEPAAQAERTRVEVVAGAPSAERGTPQPGSELQTLPRAAAVPAERTKALARVPILPGDI